MPDSSSECPFIRSLAREIKAAFDILDDWELPVLRWDTLHSHTQENTHMVCPTKVEMLFGVLSTCTHGFSPFSSSLKIHVNVCTPGRKSVFFWRTLCGSFEWGRTCNRGLAWQWTLMTWLWQSRACTARKGIGAFIGRQFACHSGCHCTSHSEAADSFHHRSGLVLPLLKRENIRIMGLPGKTISTFFLRRCVAKSRLCALSCFLFLLSSVDTPHDLAS